KETIKTQLNLELALAPEILTFALKVKPHAATFVPEKREELTTEGGLDVITHRKKLEPVIKEFQDNGIVVSLFIDPDPDQIAMAAEIGAEYIEIHTGRYCDATTPAETNNEFALIDQACITATNFGLKVNAGHGLNYRNVREIASLPDIKELNIGHSIIGHSIFVGIERAVREMKALLP
ncbi:MAG TPA: pyridoxine 5'-phosphate synthase, partial [Desulfarculaceae bacterium]|nr:pyridoxine 5'-phosphate synthase [Desulfarculaceae bacterium]